MIIIIIMALDRLNHQRNAPWGKKSKKENE